MGWHKGERVTVIGGIICAALSLWVFLTLGSASMDFSTLRSVTALPLAADFANYWAASKLALAGKAALVYNINELHEVEQQFFGTHHYYGCGWYYPPFALFWALPLGLMPYLTSLLVWTVVPLAIYAIVFRPRQSLSHVVSTIPVLPWYTTECSFRTKRLYFRNFLGRRIVTP